MVYPLLQGGVWTKVYYTILGGNNKNINNESINLVSHNSCAPHYRLTILSVVAVASAAALLPPPKVCMLIVA